MKTLNTSLLREKITIETPTGKDGDLTELHAYSNRMELDILPKGAKNNEHFIIRAQNMHTCIRFTALLLRDLEENGPVLNRTAPYDWKQIWDKAAGTYEKTYNPDRWIAVYNAGNLLFEAGTGKRHTLVDAIEKLAIKSPEYEDSLKLAERSFKKKIHPDSRLIYDGKVAMVFNAEDHETRCGIIMRGAYRTATFNFLAKSKKEKKEQDTQAQTLMEHHKCLRAAADFLDGIQLAFMVGMNDKKIKNGVFTRSSEEGKKTEEARDLISDLEAGIVQFEREYTVSYRPERPNFQSIMVDAQKMA